MTAGLMMADVADRLGDDEASVMCHMMCDMMASMATTTIGMRELHLFTRSVLETVRQKGSAVITDRGRPIARIVAISDEEAALIAAGGTVPATPRFRPPTRTVPPGRPSATEALLAMRDEDPT